MTSSADAMRRSERWRILKNKGLSNDEILKSFDTPTQMEVFSWKGNRDTIMTPRDSIYLLQVVLPGGNDVYDPANRRSESLGGWN